MKYVFLGNGRVALTVLRTLVTGDDPPVALVVHPAQRARDREEIIAASGLRSADVREAPDLGHSAGVEWLASHQPDWLISIYYGYLLSAAALRVPRRGALNLHPALLPYNRGAYPNVWSIVDGTPAGVTLHYIDANIDTGDIAVQREVPVQAADTGATLYGRLEEAAIGLFRESWPMVKAGTLPRHEQRGVGTSHVVADVKRIDRIDPNAVYRAGDLIDVLRARTFPPYRGAYLDYGDRRVYLQLHLQEEMSCD
jgi:methionyl-tRNA formyltransferase